MTKVTIIMPYQDVEEYISKSINTVLNQTLSDIEVICINDGSTDGTEDIIRQHAEQDGRIKMLSTGGMTGQANARNKGIEIAQGEYIGFVDSDDWVDLDMFEKMYNRAKEGDTDITMCGAYLYDDKTHEKYTDDYYSLKSLERLGQSVFSAEDTKDEILKINVVLWNKIYKRDFIARSGVKLASGYIYEDMPYFFDTYLKAERVNILWEQKYYYRQNRRYSTMQNSDKKVYDRLDMSELTYKILKRWKYFEEKQGEIHRWIIDDIFHRYTLLEDKYYEEYYKRMREMFINLNLTEEQKEDLRVGYCYDEFCNILERDYYGFWNFLIEKYKTSNKRIKAAEHKCNLDIIAIKDYLEEYKKEAAEEKEKLNSWWEQHSEEEKEKEAQKRLTDQYNDLEQKKREEINKIYEDFHEKITKQEYELKKWQSESLQEERERIQKEYEWKLEEQKQFYIKSLQEQKNYYENKYISVKIVLKLNKITEQILNKIKRIGKKN